MTEPRRTTDGLNLEILDMDRNYPIAPGEPTPSAIQIPRSQLRARPIGVKRPPRKGEWYLSGSDIEAYRARADMQTGFHIAELVAPKVTVTEWEAV